MEEKKKREKKFSGEPSLAWSQQLVLVPGQKAWRLQWAALTAFQRQT